MITDAVTPLEQHIADRIRDLRAASGLSLEALAAVSGVSRSMISLIERAESSPTAVVLEKLATALDVPLASLFAPSLPTGAPVARRHEQRPWKDPESRYVRRNVSPVAFGSPIQIVEVSFPPKARVAYETGARGVLIHQQVWVLDGSIDVTVGDDRHSLDPGDCLALVLDRPVVFHNPHRKTARYAVVLVTDASSRR
jgi:transcriptional regulator with XRE-family HTH domain